MDGNTSSPPWLQRSTRVIALIEDGLLAALLTAMIAVATAQIFLRNVWETGFVWGDPFTKVLVLWVALLGAMVASRHNTHIHIDVLSRFLPVKATVASGIVNALFTAGICGVVAYHAAQLVILDKDAGTFAFGVVPTWVSELIIPFGFGVIGLRYFFIAVGNAVALARNKP